MRSWRGLEFVLLTFCLIVMALRATYTEAPTVSTSPLPGNISDTVYSLTLSGLLIGALVLWLVWGICLGRIRYRFTGIEIGLGLFLLAGVVSAFGAADKRLAISHITTLAGPVVAAVLLVQILSSAPRIRLVLLVIAALGVVSAYQCAEQRFVSNEITVEQYEKSPETLLEPLGIEPGTFQHFLFEHRLYSRGIRGFFTTSNSAASFGILAVFAALALLLERLGMGRPEGARIDPRLYSAIGAAIVVAGFLLTRSKGGILGFGVAALLFIAWSSLRRWLGTHRGLVLGVACVVAQLLVLGIGYTAISYGLRHGRLPGGNSMLVRWQYWRASAQMYADHAAQGVGPGNFSHNYPRYKPAAAPESVADPHCFPLSVLCQYGPVGLIGFLAMVLWPVCKSTLSAGHDGPSDGRDPPARQLTLTMLATVLIGLLLLRPLLIPTTAGGGGDLLVYEILVLYAAPVAAFLIGFLLLAGPMPGPLKKQDRDWAPLTAALGCAVLGVLVHNLIDFAIFEPGVWTALWMVIASLVAVGHQRTGETPATRSCPAAGRLASVVVAVGLGGLYLHFVWLPACRATTKMQAAQQAVSVGQFAQAHTLLDAAFAADPLSAAALNLNGRLHLQAYEHGRARKRTSLEKAGEYFRQAVVVNPADYKNYEKAAIAYGLLEESQLAYDWYARAVERYPGCGRLHLHLGELAERLNAPEKAREHYQRAIEIEDAFRQQFRVMYPEREKVVSRLGDDNYERAKERLGALSP